MKELKKEVLRSQNQNANEANVELAREPSLKQKGGYSEKAMRGFVDNLNNEKILNAMKTKKG